MKSLIGIYSRSSDDHLDRVIQEMRRRQLLWVQFDTLSFPQYLQLATRLDTDQEGWYGDFVLHDTHYRFEDFRSIWYRRPTKRYAFSSGLSDTGYEYAKAEAQRGFGGLLSSSSTFWVSHPDAIRAAEWKPRQLVHARQVGFDVPKTLITNDPQVAIAFFEECQGEVVYKPFNQGVPRPRVGEAWGGAIYTTKLTRADLQQHAMSIPLTANLFQEYIQKAFELRITIIGLQVFAAEIHSQHSERAQVDFRMGYNDLTYAVHTLPLHIQEACLAFVRLMHLEFSAIDMLVTHDGHYVFLEGNPCGQWGWIEQHTGMPLTSTLVDLLESGQHHEGGNDG